VRMARAAAYRSYAATAGQLFSPCGSRGAEPGEPLRSAGDGGGLAWLVGTGLARALPGGSGVLSSAVAGAAIGTAIVLIERKRQKRY